MQENNCLTPSAIKNQPTNCIWPRAGTEKSIPYRRARNVSIVFPICDLGRPPFEFHTPISENLKFKIMLKKAAWFISAKPVFIVPYNIWFTASIGISTVSELAVFTMQHVIETTHVRGTQSP